MRIEERLSQALQDESDHVDVDVQRLHAATRARLEHGSPVRRTRRRWVPLLAAAAALVTLWGGLTVGTRLLGGALPFPGPATAGGDGPVAEEFTCPRTITVDEQGRRQDDSFLPSLGSGLQGPDTAGAPRYQVQRSGDRAVLRLGNADGSLASTATFRRTAGGWTLVETTKCSGVRGSVLVPESRPLRLGARDATPYPADKMVGEPERAVLLDDRSYYDTAGLVHHRTIWVTPCGEKFCLTAGQPTSYVAADAGLSDGRPVPLDLTSAFLPPDDTVGMRNPYLLYVVADPHRDVTRVWARTARGRSVAEARLLTAPNWSGRAYVVLAPADRTAAIAVRTADGFTATPVG